MRVSRETCCLPYMKSKRTCWSSCSWHNNPCNPLAQVTLETVAYANSGDVLKVQALLSLAGEHIEVEDDTLWKARLQICLPSVGQELRPYSG